LIDASVDWAFEQYEAVRDALPIAPGAGPSLRFDHLGDALAPYGTVLLDAFGVLNIGERAIPGAVDLIAALRVQGKQVAVVSNSASVPSAVTARKFHRLGFDFTDAEIVTSRDALKIGLAAEPARLWGVMAADNSQIGELEADCIRLEDAPEPYERADGFILLGSADWTTSRQRRLARALSDRMRPVFVGNPDIVAPRETGLSLEPGFYAHDLTRQTGCALSFYGKPFGNIFEVTARRIGPLLPDDTVLVGDTLHTDVLGGAALGIKTVLLVQYGLFAGKDITPYIARSTLTPTAIVQGH